MGPGVRDASDAKVNLGANRMKGKVAAHTAFTMKALD